VALAALADPAALVAEYPVPAHNPLPVRAAAALADGVSPPVPPAEALSEAAAAVEVPQEPAAPEAAAAGAAVVEVAAAAVVAAVVADAVNRITKSSTNLSGAIP
jgi:hypothetical protein